MLLAWILAFSIGLGTYGLIKFIVWGKKKHYRYIDPPVCTVKKKGQCPYNKAPDRSATHSTIAAYRMPRKKISNIKCNYQAIKNKLKPGLFIVRFRIGNLS